MKIESLLHSKVKMLNISIFLIFSFGMSSQTFEEKTEDFVRIPYKKIELKVDFLIDPSAVDSMQIDEYQFYLDENNKIKDTTLFKYYFLKYKGGKLMTNLLKAEPKNNPNQTEQLEKVMTYDSSGRLSKILTTYRGNEKSVLIEKFKYSNNIIERIYYSEKDTINPDGDMYKYRLDKDNYIIEESILINKFLRSFEFKYNNKKDIIFTNYGQYDHKLEHSYDESGNITQTMTTSTNKGDGTIEHTSLEKYIYDYNNNLVKEILDKDSNNILEYTYKDNRLIELTRFSNGKIFTKKKYKYDQFGNWIEIEFMGTSFGSPLFTEKIIKRRINYKK